MSLSFTNELDKDKRKTRLSEVKQMIKGGNPLALYTETQSDLTFSEQIELATSLVEAALEDPTNVEAKVKAVYALALARDMQYSAAGRKRMMELGFHNAMRELYEGIKITVDASD